MAKYERSGLAWAPEDRPRAERSAIERALARRLPVQARLPDPFPAWDQADLRCCVSCAVATAMELLDARKGAATRLSAMFNYYLARPSRSVLTDVQVGDALRWATRAGICPFEAHPVPFNEAGALTPPSNESRTAAAQLRLRLFADDQIGGEQAFSYFDASEPEDLDAWKRPLAAGFPLIVGFGIAEHYARLRNTSDATLAGIDRDGGAHTAVAVGYDDNALGPGDGAVRIKDSRGDNFGEHGRWRLPYSLIRAGVARELWIITTISYDT